jgi:hypothetical protein
LGFADANLMSNDFIYSAEYDGIDEKKERGNVDIKYGDNYG